MKIEKETLQRYRAAHKRKDKGALLDLNQQLQLIDYCLELLDEAAGGPDIAKLRQELAEKENQVKLILTDVHEVLNPADRLITIPVVNKARYFVATGLKYLRSPKTKDFQSWKDYREMIAEEFGVKS